MSILLKAKELGEMIANSNEIEVLKRSELDIENDIQAKELMDGFRGLKKDLIKAMQSNVSDEVLCELKEKYLNKQKEVLDNRLTNSYIEAKSSFDNLIKKVNDIITFAITGEEPCSSHGCNSHGCGSHGCSSHEPKCNK